MIGTDIGDFELPWRATYWPSFCVITLKMLDFKANCVKLVEASHTLSARKM